MPCTENVASETFADFISHYYTSPQEFMTSLGTECVDFASGSLAVVHVPLAAVEPITLSKYTYFAIPKLYGLLDSTSMDAAGILRAARLPALGNGGKDVLIGFIDTGIDYENPHFKNPDGTTRILGIWDQTHGNGNAVPGNTFRPLYGTQYTHEDINRALRSDNPRFVVPSGDENGHGTFLASIAAGSEDEAADFTGAAPKAYIAMVKLKPAKQYLRDFFLIREGADAYQENDILMGVTYLYSLARQYSLPIVVCIGLGTNQGSHTGMSALGQFLNETAAFHGSAVVVAAGNETGAGHHFRAVTEPGHDREEVELKVEETDGGFSLEFWSQDLEVYTVGFISPTGEVVRQLPAATGQENVLSFLLEETEITVYSQLAEAASGSQLIFIRFKNPMPGIWRIVVRSSLNVRGVFHMWLPGRDFVAPQTAFLKPDPDTLITGPGNAAVPMTVTAYDHTTGGIYIRASRGFSRSGQIKPEFAAPGVNVQGVSASGPPFKRMTGTSVAAAHAAGACALLLHWGVLQGNFFYMNTAALKTFFIRGAKRNPELTYPNREFGYGTLDLYQAFLGLRNL